MVVRKKDLQVDTVFSIEVPEYGYILAQLREDCCMDFFDNLREDNSWEGEDLSTAPILFTIVVAAHRLLKLFSMQVINIVKINDRPQPSMSLAFSSEVRPSTGLPGLRLEKHGKIYDPNNVDVIVPLLDAEKHRDILYSFECHGVVGKSDVLLERVSNFYKTGVNWDKQKEILYPELPLPPKGYVKITSDTLVEV
ncbi:hypothetical protein [Aeromonas sp. 5HA1]|uniref:hypothetical protein n=1 Tax=Aeromonas sp. 5HA1 TaxID=2699197 RepID=UPI0023DDC51D|nr:hypothetical protein [Aeromonas sp. 5HA1]MDF2400504.1 hypothetical protein [Aeromonas sp. 5HA1]